MPNHLRELVQQQPAARGSRGRNGVFTATRLQVYARTGNSPDDHGFVSIDALSRREARTAPVSIGLSLEDAVVLADEILAAVRAVTGTPTVHAFDFRGQALCGSGNDQDGDAPASHDPAEVTCPSCREAAHAAP